MCTRPLFFAITVRRVCALFAAALLLTAPVYAQSAGAGSIYSRFGIGQLEEFSSSQSEALGGGAFALRSLNYNPLANPALWSDQVYTRVTAGASYRTIDATDGSGTASRLAGGSLEALHFSFPIYQRKLGFGLGFQPYSQSNYRAIEQGTIPAGATQEAEVGYRVRYEGSGGLQLLRGGLGYRLSEAFRVGASADVIFGIIESRRRTTFDAVGFNPSVVTDAVRLAGVSGTIGAHLALADVLTSNDAFSIGASVSLPATLSGDRVRTLGDEGFDPDTLGTAIEGEVRLPWQGRFGLAYQPDERWTFVADGVYAPWSNFESDFARPNRGAPTRFPVSGVGTLTDRWRASIGAEVLPAGEDPVAGYFARTAYRLGGYIEHLYVTPDLNTDIHVIAATGGFSLPTALSGTRVDLNFSVGTRGTTQDGLVRDVFYGVSFNVSIGERWFQERKLR